MSTLFIPLSLAALGIVLRGAGFAFHEVSRRPGGRSLAESLFAASSVVTPFFMGTVVGAIASGRVPVGNADGRPGDRAGSTRSRSLIGVLFVATGAYLAAVFLVSDARRAGDSDLERYFTIPRHSRQRSARAPSPWPGSSSCAPTPVTSTTGSRPRACRWSLSPPSAGSAPWCSLRRGARHGVRALAVGAVVAVIWGWGVAQFPYLLPTDLTIADGAGTSTTLSMVLVVFAVAVVLVLPAIGLLYSLTQRDLLEAEADSD